MSWADIDWGELMAAIAQAYGYTPAQFLRLTLPQLRAFAAYLSRHSRAGEHAASSPARPAGPTKTVDSLADLVGMFGDEASRAALAAGRL